MLSKSNEHVIRDYLVFYRQQLLTQHNMADYFVSVLDGPVRTLFVDNYEAEINFDSIYSIMVRCYSSDSR